MAMHAQIHHDADSGDAPPTMYHYHPFYRVPKPKPPEATPEILQAFGFKPIAKPEVSNGG